MLGRLFYLVDGPHGSAQKIEVRHRRRDVAALQLAPSQTNSRVLYERNPYPYAAGAGQTTPDDGIEVMRFDVASGLVQDIGVARFQRQPLEPDLRVGWTRQVRQAVKQRGKVPFPGEVDGRWAERERRKKVGYSTRDDSAFAVELPARDPQVACHHGMRLARQITAAKYLVPSHYGRVADVLTGLVRHHGAQLFEHSTDRAGIQRLGEGILLEYERVVSVAKQALSVLQSAIVHPRSFSRRSSRSTHESLIFLNRSSIDAKRAAPTAMRGLPLPRSEYKRLRLPR